MATLAKSRQVFDAVVFLQVGRVFAVVDFQIVGAVANAAAPAVSDNRLFPPRLPFGRLNVSLVGVQTGNGIVLFHAPHYIPFSAVPVHFFCRSQALLRPSLVIPEFSFRPRMTPALPCCVGGMKMSGISRASGAGLRWELTTACRRRFRIFPSRATTLFPHIHIAPARDGNSGMTINKVRCSPVLAGVDRSGRGFNPRPAQPTQCFHFGRGGLRRFAPRAFPSSRMSSSR